MRRPEFIARQSGQPAGLLGRLLTHVMAIETVAANRAAVARLAPLPHERLLEIGCGHGRTVAALAAHAASGCVTGVDHSRDALAVARRRCAAALRRGSARLQCADSAALPFADASFDGALAVHTLYFWAPLAPHLAELRRVLTPRGRAVLAFAPPGAAVARNMPASVYTFRAAAEVAAALRAAGFARVELHTESPHLVVAVARGEHDAEA